MSDSLIISRRRFSVVVAILITHLVAIPVVITATLFAYGFEGGLTQRNQNTWVPIAEAQFSLFVLYLGFGSGRFCFRAGFLVLAFGCLIFNVVWAHARLHSFPVPVLEAWIADAKGMSFFIAPAIVSGLTLLPLRAVFGSVRLEENDSTNRYHILDLLVVTVLVAVAFGWYRFVLSDTLVFSVDVRLLAVSAGVKAACGVGCLLLILSRFWWLGALILIATIVSMRFYLSLAISWKEPWLMSVYPWAVVAATLLGFRLVGYRLDDFPNSQGRSGKNSDGDI